MTGESQGVQANPHRLPVLDSPGALTNPSGSVPRVEVTALPPTPTSGSQHWGNASSLPAQPPAYGHWVNASSSSQNSASTFSTVNPAVVFPSQSQPGFPPSDSWRLPVPSQSTVQAPVPLPNLPWGVGITDNQSNVPRQGPENQNSGWGPMPGNPNISWGPIPTNTNMNWGPSGPGPSQGNPNSGWVAPIQGQAHGNANPGWAVPGQGQNSGNAIAGWMPPGQGPAHINGNPGWVGPGQGATPGNANPGWAPQSGNQGLRGNEQNQNGDRLSNQRDRGSQAGDSSHDGGKPWNRQSSFGSGGGGGGGSGGSSRPPFKGHRVCKYYQGDRALQERSIMRLSPHLKFCKSHSNTG
ncbi:zinc finger CCCH domain-containing protein 19-like, partial [Carica papaya]|uniref:zinc finger CCCH domain-containing protein 19-like n=1 Tax=Carica papaya TaxID=3649 RepID=UPI000B8CEC14